MSDEPTAEEIARVRAHDKAQQQARFDKEAERRSARIAEHVQRITQALINERVTDIAIEGMNADGEISHSDGHLKLRFETGRVLTVEVGGWSETYLDVQIEDG